MAKIAVNDIELYYETHGNGAPLILITGFGADHVVWQNIVPTLAKQYQVITVDNRGIGQSSCPDYPYTIEMMADDIAGLCKALELTEVAVVGCSMGGDISIALVAKYPQLVKAAVFANAPTTLDIKFKLFAETQLAGLETNEDLSTLIKRVIPWVYSSQLLNRPGVIDVIIAASLENLYPATAAGYRNQLHALTNFDARPYLAEISAPCLVFGADQDMIVAAKEAKEMADAIPNSEYYCFENCGHIPHIEQTEIFLSKVLEFLSR